MKKIMFAAIAAVALSGCVSEEITWGGDKAVRQPDGTVLVDATTGRPYYEKEQNHLERFSHLNDVEFKDFHVKADKDSYEAGIGQFGSFTGSNTVAVINSGLSGTTKLVAVCGVLYAKIAGGASADIATTAISKLISYFKSSGGDTENATATLDEANKAIKVSDGSVCVECTPDGTCRDCSL